MRLRVETFARAFMLVACTAVNIGQVAAQHYGGAFLCGCLISWLWWRNARGAAHDGTTYLRECYAVGAGCGTVFGIWFVRIIYG